MWGLTLSVLSWVGLNPTAFIANLVGTSEPALALVISVFMSFPIAIAYHKYIRKNMNVKDLYFIVMGLDMAWYNFGFRLYHSLVPGIVFYVTTKLFGGSKINTLITFAFNMLYLTCGYWYTESEDYDITWTMPHCVLTLKLIALSFDLWDGVSLKNGQQLSQNSMKTALNDPPTFLQLVGFIYFPACYLIGPIFSFKRYQNFVEDEFPLDAEKKAYERHASQKLLQGVLYLIAFQVGSVVFNMKYMTSEEFNENSLFYRHFYCGMWAHFALYKYISCWLISEAACVRFGFSYNGSTSVKGNMESRWDGCNNIKLLRFETATKFQHYIDSFNCNTNYFAAEYIYKRLKFLGNRNLSQLFTLVFLALWHGIKSGYYMTFFNEFMIIYVEKECESLLKKTSLYNTMWSNPITKYILYALLKLYTIVFMGWSLAPFDLKVFPKWFDVYWSLYFSGFILFVPWPFIYKPVLKKILKPYYIAK